ncbi:cytochrome-c peroxidase [Teredinibacter purpureus]|uniref:cytochrome-c peroxidase n=1 Tax=Teredinibacter purpureus TaxID=2731756 RepID=UPI000696B2F5|nr:cytochrome c peroxidase [Teredinibacter purpureus]
MNRLFTIAIYTTCLPLLCACFFTDNTISSHYLRWSDEERSVIQSLSLSDPSTSIPTPLSLLGQKLFFDKRLSINGQVSCASCHQPEKYFTDGEQFSVNGIGESTHHTPTVVGASHNPWFFWDGRKDSLWSQALAPLENTHEQGGNRMFAVRTLQKHYATEYKKLFGEHLNFDDNKKFPLNATPNTQNTRWASNWEQMAKEDRDTVDTVFANMGKSIAAYETQLQPLPSRFDQFAESLDKKNHDTTTLSLTEQYGLRLFLNAEKTACINCHNGELFTNHDFQATGINSRVSENTQKTGRANGITAALTDSFNCFSRHATTNKDCSELRYAKTEGNELNAAFKVPTLRNIENTAPYMHNGGLGTLDDVIDYYNSAISRDNQHMDIRPLRLLPHEKHQLKAFLLTLSSPLNQDSPLLQNPHEH